MIPLTPIRSPGASGVARVFSILAIARPFLDPGLVATEPAELVVRGVNDDLRRQGPSIERIPGQNNTASERAVHLFHDILQTIHEAL